MSSEDIRDDAVRWFNLRHADAMMPADTEAFEAWIGASPAARTMYEALERNWELVGNLARDPEIMASRERDARRYGAAEGRRPPLGWLLAVAAALLLVITSRYTFLDSGMPGTRFPDRSAAETLHTGPGQRGSATLADGSVVTLDTDTQLRVVEMGARRRIELAAGHAFFRVAKDPAHPFLVTAIDKTVHAIGTAFDVRITGETVTVTLVEGKVRVDQPRGFLRRSAAADMLPGRRLVAAPGSAWTVSSINPVQATSWLDGRLTFLRDPLAKVVADVNSTSLRKIVFVDGAVPDRRIVGVFRTGDVDSVATALEMNDIAHVVAKSDTRIEMVRN